MLQTQAGIIDVDAVGNGPFVRIVVGAPDIAARLAPGTFVLADLGGFLREPLFPAHLTPQSFDVLVPSTHPGAALRPGARVDLLGPLGCGFVVPPTTRRLLLVARAMRLPPLLPLALPEQGRLRSIALLVGAESAAELYPLRHLPPAAEVHIVTADGSAGRQGSLGELFREMVGWADQVCIAEDPAGFPALAEIVRERRVSPVRGFAQALVAPAFACGVGACRGCAVSTGRGFRLACTDGPVFDLLELRQG